VRCAVEPRKGHAADASAPPYKPTATGVSDGDGDGDGVLVGLPVDAPDGDADARVDFEVETSADVEGSCVPTIEAAGDCDTIPELELDARVVDDGDATAVADGATYPSDRTTPSESENMMLPSAASAGELCTDAPVPSE